MNSWMAAIAVLAIRTVKLNARRISAMDVNLYFVWKELSV
jgi:hypothetical protein